MPRPTRRSNTADSIRRTAFAGVLGAAWACGGSDPFEDYDVLIMGGTVYDGSGGPPRVADVAIAGDTIAGVGDFAAATAATTINATGHAVAPGFINMLSWATESLLVDGRSLSDLRQGVTLEVFGEGSSMGPLNADMKREMLDRQGDLRFDVPWTSLGEYLDHLVERGVATNVASYVGATTVRIHEIGHEDRPPTPEELDRMRALVRAAMREGAMGVGSSLIYAPAFYAETDELIALASAAGEYGGGYISHLRSEGNRLIEAFDEFLTIAREAGVRAEIYHLKAAGSDNWGKLDEVIARVEAARAEGLEITADMYTYTAGSTGLDAAMPPWIHEGGHDAMIERLRDPATRERIAEEMRTPTDEWGEPSARGRLPRPCTPRRLPAGLAQAPDRPDPGRCRRDARHRDRGNRDGPRGAGRQPRGPRSTS